MPASAETPSPGERGGRALPGLPARAILPASAETPPARTPAEAHPACPPARTFLAWHREGGTAPAGMARRPPPPIYRFNPLGVVQVKSVVPTPGNSFGASPLRHRPKFARPACLGETVCQAASGHPRAGETLSPGARADAPGERRLRPTRPPRPGNIARFGRDPVRANTVRGSPGVPARTFLAWHRAGGTAPARRARRPPPPIYRFNPLGVVQVKSVVPTPGNSFGASPLRHQPKFARPACLPGRVGRETLGQRGAPAGHAIPACPPARPFLACHQAGGTAAEPRPARRWAKPSARPPAGTL